jgi:hypothetical protein
LFAYSSSYPVDSNLLDKLISVFVGHKLYPCPAAIQSEAFSIISTCILINQKSFAEQLLLSLESLSDRAATELLELTGGVPQFQSEQLFPSAPEKPISKSPLLKKGLQSKNKSIQKPAGKSSKQSTYNKGTAPASKTNSSLPKWYLQRHPNLC